MKFNGKQTNQYKKCLPVSDVRRTSCTIKRSCHNPDLIIPHPDYICCHEDIANVSLNTFRRIYNINYHFRNLIIVMSASADHEHFVDNYSVRDQSFAYLFCILTYFFVYLTYICLQQTMDTPFLVYALHLITTEPSHQQIAS